MMLERKITADMVNKLKTYQMVIKINKKVEQLEHGNTHRFSFDDLNRFPTSLPHPLHKYTECQSVISQEIRPFTTRKSAAMLQNNRS